MAVIFYRTAVLYIFLIIILRFTGKRQLGELSMPEMVTTVLMSNIAAVPIENEEKSLLSGIIPIIVIASFEIFISFISLKLPFARKLISGSERLIIKAGKPDEVMMEKLRISIDDLEEELRGRGIFDINEVEEAVVEANGSLSVLKKLPFRGLKNKDRCCGKEIKELRSYVVIKDGKVSKYALKELSVSEDVLYEKLRKLDLLPSQIFIMTLDTDGRIFYEKRKR